MKKLLFKIFIISLLTFCLGCPGISEEKDQDLVKTNEIFTQTFPGMHFDSVHKSPVAGLYEVVTGDRILYFAPDTGNILIGELYSKEKINITKNRIREIMAKRIHQLSLDQGLKIGNGPNTVIEVTDPDCSYCRKGSAYFSKRTDVTRYIYLMPLQMHPTSKTKAQYILSSANPQEAYEEVFTGKFDKTPIPPFQDNGWLDRQQKAIESLGINSTPTYWVNDNYVSGSNLRLIDKLLNPRPQNTDPANQLKAAE